MNEVTAQQVGMGLFNLLKSAVAMFTALGAFCAALWWAMEPRVEEWLEARIEGALATHNAPSNFLLVESPGLVLGKGPFEPGGVVPVMFLVQRLQGCATDVEVRFIRSATGNVDSSLTYLIPATRAPITQNAQPFVVSVRLPDNMPPGEWIYAPFLTPSLVECPGASSVSAISEVFHVGNVD